MLAAALAGAACGRPSYGDCAFTCAASQACPEGLSCVDGVCRDPAATGLCGDGENDAAAESLDGGSQADGAFCAGWSYAPSHFDPCDVAPFGSWTPAPNAYILDTTTGSLDGDDAEPPFATAVVAGEGGPLRLIAVDALDLGVNVTIRVIGDLPLVIAVHGAAVLDGAIDVSAIGAELAGPGAVAAPCSPGPQVGDDAQPDLGGGGGGGGGFGSAGGDGGDAESTVIDGGAGGAANGSPSLSPLRAGCAGAAGGKSEETLQGGAPGLGGGALQISVATTLTMAGTINASGGGGGAGGGTLSSGGGGGGGGSGGGVFLEAWSLHADGTVCAAGGGGGGGGDDDEEPGEDGNCLALSITGGPPNGGNGAGAAAPQDGDSGVDDEGGGGGGGGIGRIRLRVPVGGELTGQGSFVPQPTVEP